MEASNSFLHQDGVTFCAKLPSRNVGKGVCAHNLEDVKPIPLETYRPLLPPGCTIATIPSDCYIKKPNLMSFGGIVDLASLVLQELATCEVISKHPHPNIATYPGGMASDGRVAGLCFGRYPETLMNKVNPGHLNKSQFILSKDQTAVQMMATCYLPGNEEGFDTCTAAALLTTS